MLQPSHFSEAPLPIRSRSGESAHDSANMTRPLIHYFFGPKQHSTVNLPSNSQYSGRLHAGYDGREPRHNPATGQKLNLSGGDNADTKRSPIANPSELLDSLEGMEVALSDLMRRWEDHIPPEARVELADIYQPVLHLLIRAKRRGSPGQSV